MDALGAGEICGEGEREGVGEPVGWMGLRGRGVAPLSPRSVSNGEVVRGDLPL